jgi:hypothetical protein
MHRLTCIGLSVAVLLTLAFAIFGAPRASAVFGSPGLLADGPVPPPDCLPPIIPCSANPTGAFASPVRTLNCMRRLSDRHITEVVIIDPRQRSFRQAA